MSQSGPTLPPDAVYSRQPDIVVRQIAGETLLVPVRGELARLDRIFALNSLGEFIWVALDGKAAIAEVCSSVTAAFDVDESTAREDVIEFVSDLEDAGLVSLSARRG